MIFGPDLDIVKEIKLQYGYMVCGTARRYGRKVQKEGSLTLIWETEESGDG